MAQPSRRKLKRRSQCCLEALETRLLLSAVSWVGGSGSWNTAGNWSTGVIPQPGDDVTINQPGNIQITFNGSASINSLSITGDSLTLSGASLAVATSLTNDGSITVSPLSSLNVAGEYNQPVGGSLTLTPGSLATGVGENLLANPGFESPSATNNSTYPTAWGFWGTSYLSTQYAHTGTQSDEQSGANSGVNQSFAATPGVSYTASVYGMTPFTDKLTGSEEGILNLIFYDASGNEISAKGVTVLTANSPQSGPIAGTVGNQGWNFFTTSGVAPANAATVDVALQVGPYSGLSGTAGGAVFWDDAQFGPTASTAAVVTAGSMSNSGTITIGASDEINVTGDFLQSSTGTLTTQLGGPPASLMFGTLNVTGNATLDGTFEVLLVNGYTPAINDGFSLLNYATESGNFSSVQLPSNSTYAFADGVNPMYFGISALPVTTTTTINAADVTNTATTNFLGVNLAWWDDQLMTSQTQSMVQAAGLNIFRFPGGSTSDDFHFNNDNNYLDTAANSIPQFAEFTDSVGGQGMITVDYGSGSPQEAEAELAYLTGSPNDTTEIGTGIQWNDTSDQWQTVNWYTVGFWASLRGATRLAQDDGMNFLRIDHPAAFTGMNYWEIGNELYIPEEIDHHGTPAFGQSTGAAHDPATYAQFAATFAAFVAADKMLPSISIGIDSGDPTGASDNNWTKNVLIDGLADGFVPGFISDHSYMQAPGYESDSFLLNDTVSDPSSILDWSTRYAAYQTLLVQTLGNANAAKVQVMATEYNSVSYDPGKQTTSLVNGLFVADSIGSLLGSGYTAGLVWDLRNGDLTNDNNSSFLYGWRNLGDYGLLGDPNTTDPPDTGAYIPYPTYLAEQLASKIVQTGGQLVSATSSYSQISAYAVLEPNGHLDLMVINKNPDAAVTDQFNIAGFTPSGQAQIWQYGQAQDFAQSQSPTGAASLANSNTTINVSNGNFSYAFPAYSMTVIDLTPAIAFAVQTSSTLNVNLSNLSPVTLAIVGGMIFAAQDGVQLNFAGINAIVVTDTSTGSVLNVESAPGIPFSFVNTSRTTVNVNAGTMTIAAVPGGSVNLGTLSVASGASVILTTATTPQPTTLNLASLSIAPTGSFDVANNIVFINYGAAPDPIATIAGYLTLGYNAGAWNGFGIDSSVAAINSTSYGVGYADSADAGNPANLPAGTIKIMYTLLGDTNLDGVVDGTDFGIVAPNFNKGVTGWDQGDFNYNGVVDGTDFGDLASNFNKGANITAGLNPPAAAPATDTTTSPGNQPTSARITKPARHAPPTPPKHRRN